MGSEEQWARAYPHMLSGGMKQRAMIAMGVAAGAKTILADEPTKGLDSDRIESVIECFNMLKDETVLCVTHDVNFARAIGDNISVMYAAQQLEYAERDDFFSCPLHPYSQAIIAAMPENGLQCTVGFAPPHTEYSRLICRFAERCPQCSDRCLNEMPPMINLDGHHVRCWQYAD
ncbi:MAG: ABC transporter ATP-binding protein [Oscillospiraceae bacterium]|nr:ABC transporter ATP-binding protein [Oscillospiraceae bacterium]